MFDFNFWLFSCKGWVCFVIQCGSNFLVCRSNQCDYFLESYRRILLCSAICFVIQFYSVNQTIFCNNFLESYWTVLSCDVVVFAFLVPGSKHAIRAFFRKPTSEQHFVYGVVCIEPTACSNSSFNCRCCFSHVIIYQMKTLISIGILSISLFYNSESIDTLGLKGHINCPIYINILTWHINMTFLMISRKVMFLLTGQNNRMFISR